jgi:hypothetical protein
MVSLRIPLLCKEGLGEVEARKWTTCFYSGDDDQLNDPTLSSLTETLRVTITDKGQESTRSLKS